MHLTDERVAAAELDYLADALQPPCPLGELDLTGQLARSSTALLFTARGEPFNGEGVLKLTGSAYAPILRRELSLLLEAARAEIDGIVRPLSDDLIWLAVGGERADRPAAALPLPFLAGGDLAALATRAARAGSLGPALALEAARPVGQALRGLLTELERPVIHGDVRAQNVLLPSPEAPARELTLIDLDAAHELGPDVRPKDARLVADVRGFGEILALLSTGTLSPPTTGNRAFDALVAGCLAGDRYDSMADRQLWHDLAEAEHHASDGGRSWLRSLLSGIKRA
jgi:hypothetical protein